VTCRLRAGTLLLALLGPGLGCGKKGDPLPPLRPTPAAVTGLRAAQRGSELEIRFTAPRASTDGARLPVLEVELLVADREGDLPKVARTRRLKVAPGETVTETEPLPAPGTALRVAARAIAKGNRGRPGELVRLTVVPPLGPPSGLAVALAKEGVTLAWEGEVPAPLPTPEPTPTPEPEAPATGVAPKAQGPADPGRTLPDLPKEPPAPAPPEPPAVPEPGDEPSPGEEPRREAGEEGKSSPAALKPPAKPFAPGFFIYKRLQESSFGSPLTAEAVQERHFVDTSPRPGETVCYEIRATASAEPLVESAPSNEACVEVRDILPPTPPTGLTVLVRDDGVEIRWSPSAESDLQAYRVYRARRSGENERVGEVLAPETVYLDAEPSGRILRYVVTAVDGAGNESEPSAPEEVRRPE
jgi:hypothetical protein